VAIACDVTMPAHVETCVATVRDQFGPISILVNAAQSMEYGSIRRLTDEAYELMWRSGPGGTLRVMQACFQDLRATTGVVINFGSGSGLSAAPAMGGYASVKEAIRTLSRVTAAEWGKYGIRVNVICPLASSPGMDAWAGQLSEAGGSLLDTVPLGRLGDSEADVGRAAVFLAGPDSGYITGTTLMVDGGHDYLR
jgi:NAD(P)-dependent dehydrogenase (short-subunit alcohol dehydrogenase family)